MSKRSTAAAVAEPETVEKPKNRRTRKKATGNFGAGKRGKQGTTKGKAAGSKEPKNRRTRKKATGNFGAGKRGKQGTTKGKAAGSKEPKNRRTRKKATGNFGAGKRGKQGTTKGKAAGSKGKTAATDKLDLAVEFLGVSIGQVTGRVGCKVTRGQLTLPKADRTLCGRRLTGTIALVANGDDPDKTYLWEDAQIKITATFDVKRFGVNPDWLTFGLTFPLQEIDCRELAQFAKQQGRIRVEEIKEIPAPKRVNEDGEFEYDE